MLTQAELEEKVAQYTAQVLDIDAFEDWFRAEAWGMYDRPGDPLSDTIDKVLFALQAFEESENETRLREELAAVVRPFAQSVVSNSQSLLAQRKLVLPAGYILSSSRQIQSGNSSISWVQWDERERGSGHRNTITQSYQVMKTELFHDDVDWYYKVDTSGCAVNA